MAPTSLSDVLFQSASLAGCRDQLRLRHALEEATARKKALSSARREFGGSAKVEDVWQVSLLASFRPPNRGATFYEESDL